MVKKVLLMSCLLCSGIQLAFAQNVLKGRVVDHQGNPISGAKVENAKGSEQTTTDMNGQFSLETEGNVKKVNVYYMGMQTAHKKAKPDMLVKMGGINWWKQKPDKYSWFVSPQVAFVEHDEPNFGIMVGRVKNWGWYAKGIYSPLPDNEMSTDEYYNKWFTGEVKKGYAMASVGVIRRLFCPLHFYTGVGYGLRRISWVGSDGVEYWHKADSYDDITWEVGMQLRIKHILLNAGVNFILNEENNTFIGHRKSIGNFGIGYVF